MQICIIFHIISIPHFTKIHQFCLDSPKNQFLKYNAVIMYQTKQLIHTKKKKSYFATSAPPLDSPASFSSLLFFSLLSLSPTLSSSTFLLLSSPSLPPLATLDLPSPPAAATDCHLPFTTKVVAFQFERRGIGTSGR